MPKALAISGMVIAVLVLALFSLDLAMKVPFKRANFLMDIVFVLGAAGLAYLSWTTFREQK